LVSLPDFAVSRSPSGRLNIDIVWDVNGALSSPFPRRFAVGVETARRSTVRRSRAFPGGRLPTCSLDRSIARSLDRSLARARTHSIGHLKPIGRLVGSQQDPRRCMGVSDPQVAE
jgi:hypothetical protein